MKRKHKQERLGAGGSGREEAEKDKAPSRKGPAGTARATQAPSTDHGLGAQGPRAMGKG